MVYFEENIPNVFEGISTMEVIQEYLNNIL